MKTIDQNRRAITQALLSFPVLGLLPDSALSASTDRFSLKLLHEQTVEAARKLANGKKVTLKLLLPDGSGANVKVVANTFTRLTGIDFEFIETPVDDINTRMFLEAQISAGSYDIALPATFGIPDLVEANAIAPLEEFTELYEPTNFHDKILYNIGDTYRGVHYGYQTDGDTYLMFYNNRFLSNERLQKSFADKHGYALEVPQTWEQLDAMMAHVHAPEEGRYGGALFRTPTYMLWEWWVRFHAKGYFPMDDNLSPQINNDAGVKALEEMIEASKHQSPNATSNDLFDNWKEFANGNIFCDIGWGGTQKYLNSNLSNIRGDLKFGPTPGGIVNGQLLKTSYFNWGWVYTVAKTSAHKEIAYLFTLFACSPKMSTIAVREKDGYFDPFRLEHYEDAIIQDIYSIEFLSEHRSSMKNSIPDLYLRGQTQYYDALRAQISLAHDGKISAREALDKVAMIWNRLHAKFGHEGQLEQWQLLKELYPESTRHRLI